MTIMANFVNNKKIKIYIEYAVNQNSVISHLTAHCFWKGHFTFRCDKSIKNLKVVENVILHFQVQIQNGKRSSFFYGCTWGKLESKMQILSILFGIMTRPFSYWLESMEQHRLTKECDIVILHVYYSCVLCNPIWRRVWYWQ